MLADVIACWDKNHKRLKEYFETHVIKGYCEYIDIVRLVAEIILEWEKPIIDEVKHEEYEGNAVYVIWKRHYLLNEEGEQRNYLVTFNHYGSCSGCDTLKGVIGDDYDCYLRIPNKEEVRGLMTIAMHLVQRMRRMYWVEEHEDMEYGDNYKEKELWEEM